LLLFQFWLSKLSVPETSVLQGYDTASMGSLIHDVVILKGGEMSQQDIHTLESEDCTSPRNVWTWLYPDPASNP